MKIRTILLATIILVMLMSACMMHAQETAKKQPIKVLFEVGGWEGHDPVHLPVMLKDVLEKTGDFTITITQDRDQFKTENIKNYDLVMIYTTGGELNKEQEQGLCGFVENGGGLVGIHSATDSFHNSDAYWKMIGGKFTHHNSGTFRVKNTGKSHVIVKGTKDFDITDETYCDDFHPDSKVVVLERREMDSEPVSWVQYCGKGRVFVTALGHGKEAWENPAFQQLVTRGLLWADDKLNP